MRRRVLLKPAVVVAAAVAASVAVAVRSRDDPAPPTAAMVQPERATDELLRIQPTPPGPDDNCPRSLRRRRRPADFPATLPLPPGTLLTDVRRYEPRGFPSFVYVIGFAPLTLQQAARFFALELPRGGYRVTDGEAEDLVAEGRFGGAATGVFRMAALYRCSRFVWMVVGVSTPKRPSSRG